MAEDKNLLLDVPTELADQVAHLLPKDDLLSMRLVSKDVAARCDRAVLQCLPTELEIYFCLRKSLEKALIVSKNPIWRRKISMVRVCQDRFDLDALTGENGRKYGQYKVTGSQRAIRATRRRRRYEYRTLLDEQEQMVADDLDLQLMTDIFANLRANPNGIALTITDFWGLGSLRDMDRAMEEPYLYSKWDDDRPLRAVLTAAHRSMLQPSSLAAYTDNGDTFAVHIDIFSDAACFAGSHKTFCRLKYLKIFLNTVPRPDRAATEARDVGNFIKFLNSVSSHLTGFECTSTSGGPRHQDYLVWNTWDSVFHRMVDEVTLPVLETLTLQSLNTDYQRMLRFLGRHAHTLRQLGLDLINATGCGPHLPASQFRQKVETDLRDLGIEHGVRTGDVEHCGD